MTLSSGMRRSKRRAPSDDDDEEEEDDIEQRRRGLASGAAHASGYKGDPKAKRRKVVVEENDEEASDQQDDKDEDEDEYQASRKGKRNGNGLHTQSRTNGTNGTKGKGRHTSPIDALDSDEDSDNDAIEVEEGELVRKRKHVAPLEALVRDEDGWVPGSIMRIKLHHFLTYTDVEFRPGPHLNLVIGPNGTGKSSIVCGIALGLGFPPKILGRAPDISSFVRQGKMDAFVELELKGKIGRPNVIVKRCFQREKKSSIWTINGKSATAQQVNNEVTELGIQVDNLCCFLPQDKVASFAAMSPRELLHATMQAANEVRLPTWHDALIKTEAKLAILNTDYESNQHNLNKINEKVHELQEIVTASNERKQLEEQLDRYTLLKMHVEVGIARKEVENLKKRRLKIKAKHDTEIKKYKPLFDLRLHNASQLSDAAKAVQSKIDAASSLKEDIGKIRTRIEKEGESAEEIQTMIKNLRQTDRDRQDKIKRLEGRVEEQTRILETAEVPDQAKAADIERRRTKLKQDLLKLDASDSEYHQRKAHIKDGAGRLQDRVTQAHSNIAQLKDVKRNRRQLCSVKNPMAGYAMGWIDDKRHHFEKDVYFPAAVEVEVTDSRYAGLVESCFNRSNLMTFIAQTPRDYELLNKINDEPHYMEIGRQKKRVRIATYQVTDRDLERIHDQPPATREQLNYFGLDGFMTDFVTAPPAVMAFMRAVGVHSMALSLRNANVEGANKDLRLRNFTHQETTGFVQSVFKQSAYGNRAWQSQSTVIKAQPMFFHMNVNPERIRVFESQIETARAEQKQAEEQLVGLESERTKRVSAREKLQKQMGQVDDEQSAIKRLSRAIAQAKSEKDAAQRELVKIRNVPSVEQQRQTAQERLQSFVKKRFDLAMQGAPNLTKLEQLIYDASDKCLDSIRHQASKNHLEPINAVYQDRVAETKERWHAIGDDLREAKAAAMDSGQLFTDYKSEMLTKWDKDLSQDFDEEEPTLADVETLLADTEGDLSLQPEIDNAAEARLQIELKEQEELSRLVSKQAKKKNKYDQLHDEAKNQFEPALEKLVEDVSARFQEGLAKVKVIGQVRIRKTTSYEEWALEILVKFRDSEDLQILSHKRQSGGERSLTTIMYLESLMSLSRTPFSLVDEINQGMDQRNERAVHNLLVASTCKGTAGQYFLITPKLLTRLDYHPNMKILCINNGDWLPEPEKGIRLGDLKGNLFRIEANRQAA